MRRVHCRHRSSRTTSRFWSRPPRQAISSAFETLVGRYERKIFRLTQNITQNREDAEDAMQEAFLKAYEHLGEFQGNSRFYTWLVRIAVNQALMKLRKRRPNVVSLDEDVDTGEDTHAARGGGLGPFARGALRANRAVRNSFRV